MVSGRILANIVVVVVELQLPKPLCLSLVLTPFPFLQVEHTPMRERPAAFMNLSEQCLRSTEHSEEV